MNKIVECYCIAFLAMLMAPNVSAQNNDIDVVVYGATASGVMASISAAEEGMRVLLIEPGKYVGGMVTGGLSHTDYGDKSVIGGKALKFYKKIAEHYQAQLFYWRGPEPRIGEEIMTNWLKESGVEVLFNKKIIDVYKEGSSIQGILLNDSTRIKGKIFIDAGYEGDLMARSGVSYVVGREGVKDYNESWAGRQPIMQTSHQINVRIDPFVNEKEKKLLPLVNPKPMVKVGEGDKGIQSYCFRLIATDRKDNMIPWSKPPNYDPDTYELARRYYKARPNGNSLIGFGVSLPNGKADINSSAGISTNLLDGSSWEYPEADYDKRDSIWQWHKEYTLGLAWFLSTDPVVPKAVRKKMKTFGLCKDEYVDNDHFPHQLYVRVARRMKGEYFMTQRDLVKDTIKYDAIGMGAYNIDVREVQRNYISISRFPDMKYEVYNEGYMSIPVAQYQIPYRSLTPKFSECSNLLVPVCVSGSALAIASIRMEPQYMIMGHSAGVAASMAVKSKRSVQQIDVYELQQKLETQEQVLSLEENPYGLWNTENSIVIDNHMKGFTSFNGDWRVVESIHPERYEMNYRYLPAGNIGDFEYRPYLFHSGDYDVYLWHPSSNNHASEVRVRLYHENGEETVKIDQQKNGGKWVKAGRFPYKKGKGLRLAIEARNDSKMTIADAVKFELVQK